MLVVARTFFFSVFPKRGAKPRSGRSLTLPELRSVLVVGLGLVDALSRFYKKKRSHTRRKTRNSPYTSIK